MTPSRSQATSRPAAPARKATNHRRVWFFTIALLLALAFGAAMFKAVLAGPPPMAEGPARPAPMTPAPSTPPSTPRPSDPWAPPDPSSPSEPSSPSNPSSPSDPSSSSAAAPARDDDEAEASEPRPAPTTPSTVAVRYQNCGQARKAGAAPIQREDPGYSTTLDKDGDGVACETGKD